MNRLLWCLVVVAAACGEGSGPSGPPRLLVKPVLDSVFAGDTGVTHSVIFLGAAGDTIAPGPVRWSSLGPTVFTVDSVSGKITTVSPGIAILVGTESGVSGRAVVVVSDTLQVTALLDTIYLLPSDTITIPVVVQRKGGSPPAPWFATANAAIDTVDSASGVLTSLATGTARYFVHAGALADTATIVVRPADTATAHSRSFFSVSGPANPRAGGLAYAINYTQHGGAPASPLRPFSQGGPTAQANPLSAILTTVDSARTFGIHPIRPVAAV